MKTRDGGYISPDKRFGSGGSKQRKKNVNNATPEENNQKMKTSWYDADYEKAEYDRTHPYRAPKRSGFAIKKGSAVKNEEGSTKDRLNKVITATIAPEKEMNVFSSVKMKPGGFAMNKGKAVKTEKGAAKDTLAKKEQTGGKDSLAGSSRTPSQNAGTKKDSVTAPANTGTKKDSVSAPANTGTKNDTKTPTGNGFLNKVKSSVSSKDRINAALAWTGSKKSAKPNGTKQDTSKVTEKADKTNKQKAKKNKAATVKSETISGPFNATEAMKARRAAAEAAGKGKFNATEEMKKRRAAAEAAGKGKFNATEEMKKRRAAAEAAGKGKWNAQEEMRKRREAAANKKKIQQGFTGK